MPVLFPDNVKHNNDDRPILDLNNNQVKGLGIFASVSDRDSLDSTIRTDGFLALTQVDSQYKAFVYTGNTWGSTDSWTEVGGDALPAGSNFSVLVRDATNAVAFDTTPRVSAVAVFNSSGSTAPNIVFTRTSDDSGVAQATGNDDVLGQITFKGHNSSDTVTDSGMVRFTQVGSATANVSSKLEVSVGTSTGSQVGLTLNQERVLSVARQASTPTAVAGGLYADTSDNVYFGVS